MSCRKNIDLLAISIWYHNCIKKNFSNYLHATELELQCHNSVLPLKGADGIKVHCFKFVSQTQLLAGDSFNSFSSICI